MTRSYRASPDVAARARILDDNRLSFNPGVVVNAVLVDLASGRAREVGVLKSDAACVTMLIVDPVGKKVVQAYQQFGLACGSEKRIDVLRLQ